VSVHRFTSFKDIFRDQSEKFSRLRNTETVYTRHTFSVREVQCRRKVCSALAAESGSAIFDGAAPLPELFLRRDGQGEPREMTDDRSVTSRITLTVAIVTKTETLKKLPSIDYQL